MNRPQVSGAVYRATDLRPDNSRLVAHVGDELVVVDVPPTANPIKAMREVAEGLLVTTEHPHGLFASDRDGFVPVATPDLALTPGGAVAPSCLVYHSELAFIVPRAVYRDILSHADERPLRVSTSVTGSVHNLVATVAARLPPMLTFANGSDGSVRLSSPSRLRVQSTGLAQFLRLQPARGSDTSAVGVLPMQQFSAPLHPKGVAETIVAAMSPTRVLDATQLVRVLNGHGSHDVILPPGCYDGEIVVAVFNAQMRRKGVTAALSDEGALLLSADQPFTVIGGAAACVKTPALSVGDWFEAHGCHDVVMSLFRRTDSGFSALPARAFPVATRGSEMVEFQGMTICADASVFHAPAALSGLWRGFDALHERLCAADIAAGDQRSFTRVDPRPLNFLSLKVDGIGVSFTHRADPIAGKVTEFRAVTKTDQTFKS